MSTPNPLIPQGTQLGQNARNRSFPVAIALIAALHVVGLGGLLFLGCSPNNKSGTEVAKDKDPVPPPVTSPTTPAPLTEVGAHGSGAEPIPAPVTAAPTGSSQPITPAPVTPSPLSPPLVPGAASGTGDGWQPGGAGSALHGASGAGTGAGAGTSAGGLTEYKVKKGDIGVSIAKAHGITVKALSDANPGVDWRRLRDGQTVQIPAAAAAAASGAAGGGTAPGTTGGGIDSGGGRVEAGGSGAVHLVKKGETLISIGRQHGVSWRAIRSANALRSDALREGQKLKIPAASASGAGASRGDAGGAGAAAGGGAGPVAVPMAPGTPGGTVPR